MARRKLPDGEDTVNRLLSNPHLVLMARVFVGLLFIFSSLEKIVDPASFAQAISNYKLLPLSMPMTLATIIPWLELMCGFTLLSGVLMRGGSLLLASMLLVFTVAVISGIIRELDISCGCFTRDPDADKIGWIKVLQNSTLFALTLFIYYSNTSRYTLASTLQAIASGDNQSS